MKIFGKSTKITEIKRPTIAIDFDGMIHKYSKGWQDGKIYDPPMEGVKEALEELSKKYRLIIFTTREPGTPPELGTIKNTSNVWWWLHKYELDKYIYDITNIKPMEAKLFIDDRALRFTNWKDVLGKVPQLVKSITIGNGTIILSKAIKGNDPQQISFFGKPIAGMEKEFAPNDKRRLEVTNGGKLRWKNADASTSSPQVQSAERRVPNEKSPGKINPKFVGKKFKVPTFGVAMNPDFKMPVKAEGETIDNDEIAEIYCEHPISAHVDRLSNKAQKIFDDARSSDAKQIAYGLWNLGSSIQETFVEKITKGEPTSDEDIAEIKNIVDEAIKGADEEVDKKSNPRPLKVLKKKKEITAPSYRRLQEGEASLVERRYKAYKELKFYAAHEKIESPDDVAYLFNQLQDEAVEHGFVAHETKDHRIIVQHISTGTFNSSIFDSKQIWDAIDRFGSTKIHMVHNHPSGNIQPSSEDISIWNKIKEGLPKEVEMMPGVIIDAREGVYGFFETGGPRSGKKEMPDIDNKDSKPIKALRFSKQIFKEDATLTKKKITQPDDIAKFIYQCKFTDGNKAQVFSLSSSNSVVGRFNISSSLDDPKAVADEVGVLLGRSGGVNAIISTNKEFDGIFGSKLNAIEQQLKIKDIVLFDCISINKENSWKSAVKERIFEHSAEYKKSGILRLLKAFGKQINLFGDGPYSNEGQMKEGKGGTLKLTRDQKGKGAHWRIVNGKQKSEDRSEKLEDGGKQKQQNKGEIITISQAYDLLADKLGNKAFVTDKDGNLLGEGTFQLMNENSGGNYSLFLNEQNGNDNVIPVPANQAAMQIENGVQFKFADKDITISLKEKSLDQSKPIEIQKAEENAKRAKELEKMRTYNRWNEKAKNYADIAKGQKDWFFKDMEDAANRLNIEYSNNNKIVKKPEVLFKEIKRNATKYNREEIHSALISAFEVNSPAKAKQVISELKKKDYKIADDILDNIADKENFFVRIAISKGEYDPCPKELQFATPGLSKAHEECAKKPNVLRETETSLKLKVEAESIPEYLKVKNKLFGEAGEGLGQLWITGGLPGSGKSSVLEGGFHKNKIVVDPDEIKYLLGEERRISRDEINKNPSDLHEESSLLAKHLTREAVRDGKDVIYDVTMKGTTNLTDLLELVKNDTFQANAKFIHIPIEKGIERDAKRGEHGGRSIGAKLYKKLFGSYPTHKAFFQLKDDFDNFQVYDNTAPLGEGAKMFYSKEDGREEVLLPEVFEEFKKVGQIVKSIFARIRKKNILKSFGNENLENGGINENEIDNSIKVKMMFRQMTGGQVGFDKNRELDPEQDFFELGMLKLHGLIDENMQLTEAGEKYFEKNFGSRFTPASNLEQIANPTKNIAEGDQDYEQEQAVKKSIRFNIFGKSIDKSKNNLLPSEKNPTVRRWQKRANIEVGDFGPIFKEFYHKPNEAIKFLLENKTGEAPGALWHPQIGDIDLVYGYEGTGRSDGYGISKIAKYHSEVLNELQNILIHMQISNKTQNRIRLQSKNHEAAISLNWYGKEKIWLLTAYEKIKKPEGR